VDRRNYHTFQPLLYQVATAGLDSASIAYPVRGVVHHQENLDFRVGTVDSVDPVGRRVCLEGGDELAYDWLIVAAGAVTATFGVPGVEEHAFALKSLTDAIRLRGHLLARFEEADAHPERAGAGDLTVVVVGGGPTGVELSGGMAELFYTVLCRDYPGLDLVASPPDPLHPRRGRIVLLEATDRLLGSFGTRSSADAADQLRRRGVDVRLGAAVEEVAADHVRLAGGEVIPTRTLVWTAGVRANPLGARLGLPLGPGGRVVVGPDLAVPARPEVFVIGDLAAASDHRGRLYPQLAPVAMQQARHAVHQIERRIKGRPTARFRYFDKGTMATIGRNAAVAELPLGIRLRGFLAWLAWLGLHLVFLIGFRNRLSVLLDWSWNYLTYERGVRLILPVGSDDPPALRPPPGGPPRGSGPGSPPGPPSDR
jgi:NADH:ubiquinone reductase (H+-translocating)